MHVDGRIDGVGPLDTSANVAKVLAARLVLASVVDAGFLAPERATAFEFRYYFSSVDAWLEYLAEHWTSAVVDPATITRVRELIRDTTGELVIRERVHVARLRRAQPPEIAALWAPV